MAVTVSRRNRVGRILLWLLGVLALVAVLVAGLLWWGMQRSVPRLEGEVAAAELSGPVSVARDAQGTATVTGTTRRDLAYALGYLHAQDRLFQMDMLRRLAAGELSEISGDLTADIDRRIRPHRFRARAKAMVAGMPAEERALLSAYVAGVNRGMADLKGAPFEYLLTWSSPEPWLPEDSILAVYAMYLNLQPATPQREMDIARAQRAVGVEMAAFLYPSTTPLDAPIDGSILPEPPLPAGVAPLAAPPPIPGLVEDVRLPEAVGSNNWAVGGALTAAGAALVANDMHLGLSVPSTWYRARMVLQRAPGSTERPLNMTGVTLPGTPFLVAGSNGRVAWGFTNSYIDTADAVIVEWVDARAGSYRVPGGTATAERRIERLCVRSACEPFEVVDTIWGPIVGRDAFGRWIAMRWTAHNPDAVRLGAALAMEQTGSVAEAIAVAQRSGIPQQNLMVGDAAGNIGWTIIGRIPKRFGFTGDRAVSFADGTRGWAGDLSPEETPTVVNPADHRLWTANSRVMGGDAFVKLGDGGYDSGARAGRIRDLLRAKTRFAPADFLAIQLDARATRNDFWAALMLAELERQKDPRLTAMLGPVRDWGGVAVPGAVGYRLVDRFRKAVVEGLYQSFVGVPPEGGVRRTYVPSQGEGAARRLLDERPAALVPKGHKSWDAFLDAALAEVASDVDAAAGGNLLRYTWGTEGGDVGRAKISHPLARAIAPLAWVTNPRDTALPGDRPTVRAQAPGFGASERFAVSPGREAEGLFHMPGGQAGSPMTPWYLAGHEDWVAGKPTPFLPGPAKWRLQMVPAR